MSNEDGDDLEQWRAAQAYAALMGEIPSSFTIASRALKTDTEKNATTLSDATRYQVGRLLKSALVDEIIQAFTKHHSLLLPGNPKTAEELPQSIPPIDLATVLSVIYFYRRIKKLVPEEEWAYVQPFFARDIDLAGLTGLAIKKVGLSRGLLSVAGRYFALAPFLLHDKKGFTEYRRYLKGRNFMFDPTWEMSRWGCHGGHVAATMFQSFGLGVQLITGLADGIGSPSTQAPRDPTQYGIWLAAEWVRSLSATGKEPDMPQKPAFYPDNEPLSQLIEIAKSLKGSTSGISRWLSAEVAAATSDDAE